MPAQVQNHQLAKVDKSYKHEIISVQASTVPSWSAPVSFLIKNIGGLIIHDAVVSWSFSNSISGLTGSVTNYPNLNPAFFFYTSFDVNVGGTTVSTHRPEAQFILNNLLFPDEHRMLLNTEAGSYSSAAARSAINTANGKYYQKLEVSLFDAANFKVINPSSEVEIKFNMQTLANVCNQSTLTGTPVLNFSSAELLLRVSRIPQAMVQNELSQLIKFPKHYYFHRPQYQAINLAASTTTAQVLLSAINGNISHLYFIIRPNTGLTNLNQWSFTQVSSFELRDASNASLSGSRLQLDRESRLNQARYWTKSTYLADYENNISNSFVYFYSFSADPVAATQSGARLNSYRFTGTESLVINYPSLGASSLLEVFAYGEAVLEQSASGIKLLSS